MLGLSLSAPLAAAEDIRPPQLVGGAIGAQDAPSAAFDGRAFAVVWQDRRSSSLHERPAMRAARVSVAGVLLDDPARVVGDTWPNIHAFPQAAHCFGRIIAVWQDGYEVRVQLVGESQEPPAEPIRIPATQGYPPLPSVACSETQALVVWRAEARGEIRGLRLGPTGPLDTQPFRISRDDQESGTEQPRVASDGQGYFVVYQRTSRQGRVLEGAWLAVGDARPRPFVIARGPAGSTAAVATASPARFLVTWVAGGVSGPLQAAAIHVDRPEATHVTPLENGASAHPALIAHGGGYVAAWTAFVGGAAPSIGQGIGEIRVARLTEDGRVLGDVVRVSDPGANVDRPTLAASADALWVAWSDAQVGSHAALQAPSYAPDVWGRLLASDGTPRSPVVRLSRGPGAQRSPAAASDGDGFLLAWVSEHVHPPELRVSRVSSSGTLLDGEGVPVARDHIRELRVAAGGQEYLVAWRARAVRAARVSAGGALLDREPLDLGPSARSLDVAHDGRGFVVALGRDKEIVSLRVDGGKPSAPVRAGVDPFGSAALAVGCAPGSCLLAWTERNNAYNFTRIAGQRVLDERVEVLAHHPRPLSRTQGHRALPTVAWTGDRYLVAWAVDRRTIESVMVSWDGLLFGVPEELMTGGPLLALESYPVGGDWVIAWQQGEGDQRAVHWAMTDGESLRSAERVAKAWSPALAAVSRGELLVAWQERDAGTGAERVRGRLTSVRPRPAPGLPEALQPPQSPASLPAVLARVRDIVSGEGWRRRGFRDAALETEVARLLHRVQAAAGRGRMPVQFGEVVRGRTAVRERLLLAPEGELRRTFAASDRPDVVADLWVGRGGTFRRAERAILLADGDLEIGFADDSILIATGSVDVAHMNRCLVFAGGDVEVSHEGSELDLGRGFPSVILARRTIDAGHARGTVLGAGDGTWGGRGNGVVRWNATGADGIMDPDLQLDDSLELPWPQSLELAVADAPRPRVDLFLKGGTGRVDYGYWKWPLAATEAARELEGFAVSFASHERVVLRRGRERIEAVPSRQAAPPPAVSFQSLGEFVVLGAGVYEPARPDGVVAVEIAPSSKPIVLVLSSHESAMWQIAAAAGVRLAAVLLVGYQDARVTGIPPEVPVHVRIHQFGEQGVNAYRKADGTPSEGYGQLDALVSRLTGQRIAAFTGAERAEQLVVGAGAARTN